MLKSKYWLCHERMLKGGSGEGTQKKGYLRTVEGKEGNKSVESELDMKGKRETLI